MAVVENSAAIGCTVEEIAAVLGVGRRTVYDRIQTDPALGEALERGREKGKATLRRLQWQAAEKGDRTILIWLGKQLLGQRDFFDQKGQVELRPAPPRLDLSALNREELLQIEAACELLEKAQQVAAVQR